MQSQENTASSSSPSPQDLYEAIRRRAEEIYEKSGRAAGRDLENWVQAEGEIQREVATRSAHRRAVVVKVNGVHLVGEYTPAEAHGYAPGEFAAGDPVSVRLEGGKMFVKRRDGSELETTIVEEENS